jgi:hypothetical protein
MIEEPNTMAIEYRPVREDEMPATVELFLTTVAGLQKRWNLNWPLPPREYIEKSYEHIRRTGIFLVAEVDGKLRAICHNVRAVTLLIFMRRT